MENGRETGARHCGFFARITTDFGGVLCNLGNYGLHGHFYWRWLLIFFNFELDEKGLLELLRDLKADYHLGVQTILSWGMLKGLLVVNWWDVIDFCSLWMCVNFKGVIDYVVLYHGKP